MRVIVLLLLSACVYVRTPAEVIGTPAVMCRPLTNTHWVCRDDAERVWNCVDQFGRWGCSR